MNFTFLSSIVFCIIFITLRIWTSINIIKRRKSKVDELNKCRIYNKVWGKFNTMVRIKKINKDKIESILGYLIEEEIYVGDIENKNEIKEIYKVLKKDNITEEHLNKIYEILDD